MYKINIFRPVPDTVEAATIPSGVFVCPVCEGNADECVFCEGTGEVSAEKLSTFEPSQV